MEVPGSATGTSTETLKRMEEMTIEMKKQDDKNKTAIVKVQKEENGLVALKGDDCLKSLMKTGQP